MLDSETDPDAAGLLARFELDAATAAGGRSRPASRCCATRRPPTLADALGLTEAIDPTIVYDVAVVGAGPGRARRRRLCRLRRAEDDRHRGHGAGRPGRHQLQDRELSRLPDRHLRRGAGRPRAGAGAEIRRPPRDLAHGGAARLRSARRTGSSSRAARSIAARSIVVATGARYRKLDVAELRASSRARASTTPRPPWRRSSASARRWRWWAAATRPARPPSSCRASPATCTCWCAPPGWRRPCRTTSSSASSPRRGSRCTPIRRSPRSTATTALRQVTWTDRRDRRAATTRDMGNLFVMIGAAPNTDWLDGCLDLDDKGFVLTGQETARGLALRDRRAGHLRGRRRPLRAR